MNPSSIPFLKITIYGIGIAVLALAVFLAFVAIESEDGGVIPVVIGMYLAAVPFYIALHQTLKLLRLVEQNCAFSNSSVKALKNIRYCAISICITYSAIMPFFVLVADADDAPGFGVLAVVIILASVAIATFAAVLQKLLEDALEMKSENDLTV